MRGQINIDFQDLERTIMLLAPAFSRDNLAPGTRATARGLILSPVTASELKLLTHTKLKRGEITWLPNSRRQRFNRNRFRLRAPELGVRLEGSKLLLICQHWNITPNKFGIILFES